MLLCSKTEFSVKPWSNKIVLELVWGYPDKYYLCFIHSNTYNYNPLALTCYDHQFIYMYRVFYLTLMVEIINLCTYWVFARTPILVIIISIFFPHSAVVDYYINVLYFLLIWPLSTVITQNKQA